MDGGAGYRGRTIYLWRSMDLTVEAGLPFRKDALSSEPAKREPKRDMNFSPSPFAPLMDAVANSPSVFAEMPSAESQRMR
jgi:hypothetical protein